jgi:UDP-galactopyranose mutase
MSFTDSDVKFTRIIEHKHFEFSNCKGTVITREYSKTWNKGDDAYYPINDDKNNELYLKYFKLAEQQPKTIFGGRLGHYKYYDMDKTIAAALELVKIEFNNEVF